jgi:hypothetical protein
MNAKLILTILLSLLIVPAAFCWEYTTTFDADPGWTYFDGDAGTGTAVSQEAWEGTLSMPWPMFTVRYIFADSNTPGFGSNVDLSSPAAYVQANIRWTGGELNSSNCVAYFFLAGGGDNSDDIWVWSDPNSASGSQTFWTSDVALYDLGLGSEWVNTGDIYLNADNFSLFSPGTKHDQRRGAADSWNASIQSVDAVGIILGYFGMEPGSFEISEFTVTPEPSFLLLSGPLAGFLGWRIHRKGRKSARKT